MEGRAVTKCENLCPRTPTVAVRNTNSPSSTGTESQTVFLVFRFSWLQEGSAMNKTVTFFCGRTLKSTQVGIYKKENVLKGMLRCAAWFCQKNKGSLMEEKKSKQHVGLSWSLKNNLDFMLSPRNFSFQNTLFPAFFLLWFKTQTKHKSVLRLTSAPMDFNKQLIKRRWTFTGDLFFTFSSRSFLGPRTCSELGKLVSLWQQNIAVTDEKTWL